MFLTNRHEMDMCEGPLFGKILRFSLPLMLSGILQLLFNAADIVVVSRFAADGNTALAAVGSTGALIGLIVNLFMGLSTGATVAVSRSMGARNMESVKRCVHTAITVAAICGVAVGLFGFLCASPFLSWMDTPPSVLPDATLYMRIYFCGLPVMMLYNFGASILRAVGDTKRPLYYLSVAGVLNVIFNLVFVIVFHLDVAGVALATVLSQCLAAALVIRCLIVNGGAVKLTPSALRIHKTEFWQMVRVGLPAGIQASLFSVSNVLNQSAINSFGDVVVAGNAAATTIENFVYISMNAFSQSAITFVGQNAGASKISRVRRAVFLTAGIVSVLGIVMGGAVYFLGEILLGIYRPGETDVIAAGMIRMAYILPPYFICGVMEVLAGAMRGLGRSVSPMIVSLLGACGFRILWLYTFFAWNPTLDTLYLSYPLSWAITAGVHAVCLTVAYRTVKRSLPSAE